MSIGSFRGYRKILAMLLVLLAGIGLELHKGLSESASLFLVGILGTFIAGNAANSIVAMKTGRAPKQEVSSDVPLDVKMPTAEVTEPQPAPSVNETGLLTAARFEQFTTNTDLAVAQLLQNQVAAAKQLQDVGDALMWLMKDRMAEKGPADEPVRDHRTVSRG